MAEQTHESAPLRADAMVTCPQDGLDFRPFYTSGKCPLCGWAPEGEVARPWTHSADWTLIAFAGLVVTSVIMAIVVYVAL